MSFGEVAQHGLRCTVFSATLVSRELFVPSFPKTAQRGGADEHLAAQLVVIHLVHGGGPSGHRVSLVACVFDNAAYCSDCDEPVAARERLVPADLIADRKSMVADRLRASRRRRQEWCSRWTSGRGWGGHSATSLRERARTEWIAAVVSTEPWQCSAVVCCYLHQRIRR